MPRPMNELILKRFIASFVVISFITSLIFPSVGGAQNIFNLPAPGTHLTTSAAFSPAMITGMTIHPENPLQFDFIVDTGDDRLQGEVLKEESQKLINYFMATLTVPEDEMWVNLSPYEKNRIIADGLSQTEMGRDMLAQDYLLKQLTASLMNPENKVGQEFWEKVYAQVQEKFGAAEIPTDLFNKVWIVPQEASVYKNGNHIFIVNSHLKVMLEQDYLALEENKNTIKHGLGNVAETDIKTIGGTSAQLIREVLLPVIEKEVNEGKNFANLRQIYNSMILATWYKKKLKDSVFSQVYLDQNKINGIELEDKNVKEKIYNQYLDAFKKGVTDVVKEEYDPATQEVIAKKYVTGGLTKVDAATLGETDQLPQRWIEEQEKNPDVRVAAGGSLLPSKIDYSANSSPDRAITVGAGHSTHKAVGKEEADHAMMSGGKDRWRQLWDRINPLKRNKNFKKETSGTRIEVEETGESFELDFVNLKKYLNEDERSVLEHEKGYLTSIIEQLASQEVSRSATPEARKIVVENLADTGVSRVFLVTWDKKKYVIKRSTGGFYNKYIDNQWNVLQRLNPEGSHPDIAQPLMRGSGSIKYSPDYSENIIFYLVTNYFEGEGLYQQVETRGKFSNQRVIDFGLKLSKLVKYVHQQGVIIRELKPQNIMIRKNGTVALYDFNVSMMSDYNWENDPYDFKSTVKHGYADDGWEYFNRHQERNKPDEMSDVFTIGMDLFLAATGEEYYQGKHRKKIGLEEVKNGLLKSIIGRAIAPRQMRYNNVDELIADLEKLRSGLEEGDRDKAQLADEWGQTPGGIDFNSTNLNLKEQGQGSDINFSFEALQNIQPNAVNGILPIIINITPIANFYQLLGLSEKQPTDQLDNLTINIRILDK